MLLNEKSQHRKPLIHSATKGIPGTSIDSVLAKITPLINPWDTIKLLGAQLCRPPMDPYREEIDTTLFLGELRTGSPIVVSTTNRALPELSDKVYGALYRAMEMLGEQGITHAIISDSVPEKYLTRRGFKLILDLRTASDSITESDLGTVATLFSHEQQQGIRHADGILLKYVAHKFGYVLSEARRYISPESPDLVPIIVQVTDPHDIPKILDEGLDAVVVDVYGEPLQQLAKICEAKRVFRDYFRNKDIDRQLLFTNGPDDAGRVVKTIAMGATTAHGAVYDVPSFIAYALQNATKISRGIDGEPILGGDGEPLQVPYGTEEIAVAVSNYLRETRLEITQLVAAAGYSNCFNVSDSNLRTSSPDVSLATRLMMEGIDTSWFGYHHGILARAFEETGVQLEKIPREKSEELVTLFIDSLSKKDMAE